MHRFERADEILSSFTVDDLPYFSRTVFTSSPVLLTLHLESGDAVPLPHVAVGTHAGHSAAATPSCVIRRNSFPEGTNVAGAGGSGGGAAWDESLELPESLQQLLRLHKRAAYSLFYRWEQSGQREVPLNAFAEGVKHITGERLSDEDLLSVVLCVEPVRREDVLADPDWRTRPLDCNRLSRRLQSCAARLASNYIHQVHGAKPAPAAAKPTQRSLANLHMLEESGEAPLLPGVSSKRKEHRESTSPPSSSRRVTGTHAEGKPVASPQTHAQAMAKVAFEKAQATLIDALGQRLTELTDLFKHWDDDGNGTVDKAEFRAVVDALGLQFEDNVIDAVFDSYDADGSGTIEYTEYITYSLRHALARSMARVMDLFRKWDVDQSGAIDKKEFRIALKELGFDAPRETVDALFAQMDKDGGGTIEFSELHAQLRPGALIKLPKALRAA